MSEFLAPPDDNSPPSVVQQPILYVTKNSVAVSNGQTFDLGNFVQSSTNSTFILQISNNGDQSLVFPQNGISISGSKISLNSNITSNGSYTLTPGNSVQITVSIIISSTGTFTNQKIILSSNDIANPTFTININFTVSVSTQAPPTTPHPGKISVKYGTTTISNNGVLSILSAPLNVSTSATITIGNSGVDDLTITNVSVSGDATVPTNTPVKAGAKIASTTTYNFVLNLSVATAGTKKITVILYTTDTTNNPFVFTLTYSVLPAYDLRILDSTNTSLSSDNEIALGFIDKGTIPVKTYIIRNEGILNSIIINSITCSGDIIMQGSASLPITLNVGGSNALSFSVGFISSTVGQKAGDITIDWSVSS